MNNEGWKCPGCGRCYSPLWMECGYCGKTATVTVTGQSVGAMPSGALYCAVCRESAVYLVNGQCLTCRAKGGCA